MLEEPRKLLTSLFRTAVAAADPRLTLHEHLPPRPRGRTIVVGAGKGVAQMAAAFEAAWGGPVEGAVVTRHGFGAPTARIEVLEAGHPLPDADGLVASRRLLALAESAGEDDLVIALMCGGGSALLPSPPAGLTLADEISVHEALLMSGAPISAMNLIRKHVSTIKGGRLAAAAYPAKVHSLVVSDIPGDDLSLVASGPTLASPGTRLEALAAIETYGVKLPPAVRAHLATADADAPAPHDPRFARNQARMIASAGISLQAAAAHAEKQGIKAVILSDSLEGEARELGALHGAIAREIATRNRPFAKPVLILSGGESTVTIRSAHGRGGRNSEFMLGLALAIDGVPGIDALAADTDGIDGSENNAGAFADSGSVQRMRAVGVDPKRLLADHDSWRAFDAAGDLCVTGPTGTNVNDFRAILVL